VTNHTERGWSLFIAKKSYRISTCLCRSLAKFYDNLFAYLDVSPIISAHAKLT